MRADRLLSMVILLQTRGKMTAENLASELEVSRRTILRDVEALSIAGIPIYTEGGHGGGIALDEHYRTSLTGLNESEVRTLFIAGHARRLDDLGLGDAAASTLMKLLASIPTAHQAPVEQMRQRILIDPDWWYYDSQPMSFWDDLVQAVYENMCMAVVYENYQGDIAERIIQPYSLVAKSSIWYLVARRDDEFRTYRVARFQQVTRLDQTFERLPDFDLASYWREHLAAFTQTISGYQFTLRVAPEGLNFITQLVPGRYTTIREDKDGWQVIRFQLETRELAKMMVFGLGNLAAIIEPSELREIVMQTAREILASSSG